MDDIKNCKNCGNIFHDVLDTGLCPVCTEIENNNYETIVQYLAEHTDENIDTVAKNTRIDKKEILKWLKEGRIITHEKNILKCSNCGKPIDKGEFCSECAEKIKKNIEKEKIQDEYFLSKGVKKI